MVDSSYGFWEKVIWFCVHVFCTCLLIVFLSYAWTEFVQQYFATTLYDPLYPIEKVAFPAVSICSNNRISQREAAKYAEDLRMVDPDNRSDEYYMERIKLLGYLYEDDLIMEMADVSQFQQYLDIYGTAENESYYNTLRMLHRLTPACENLLIKCTVAGLVIDCISKESFAESLTMYGYCCTFNYNNKYRVRTRKTNFAHSDLGLTVILNTSSADVHYPLFKTDSTVVLIHSAYKYADVSSGGTSEFVITNGKDNFLSVRPYVVDSEKTLRQFSPKTRNCYFDDEKPSMYKLGRLRYSFNNCLTRCRIQSIIILCKCLPFNYPHELSPEGTKTVYCSLQHLACLQKYRFKWKSIMSSRITIPGLEKEAEDALYCPQCLPSCDDIIYKAVLNSLPVILASTSELRPHDQSDVTILRVYFEKITTKYYRQIVKNSWFEAFSTIGNYCGIILGFSLTVICEVVYFIGRQILLALRRARHNERQALIIYP